MNVSDFNLYYHNTFCKYKGQPVYVQEVRGDRILLKDRNYNLLTTVVFNEEFLKDFEKVPIQDKVITARGSCLYIGVEPVQRRFKSLSELNILNSRDNPINLGARFPKNYDICMSLVSCPYYPLSDAYDSIYNDGAWAVALDEKYALSQDDNRGVVLVRKDQIVADIKEIGDGARSLVFKKFPRAYQDLLNDELHNKEIWEWRQR